MRRLLLVLPAIVLLTLAAPQVVSRWNHEVDPGPTRDIRNNPASREVRATLIDAFGPDALDIVVGVEDNVAVLSGEVRERPTQRLAGHVAESVDGILVVHNFLSLTGGSGDPVDHALASRDLTLKKRLSSELAPDISVDACDGVVLLRGTLPDNVRHDAAVRIAEELADVTKVIDLLHVTWTSSMPAVVQVAYTTDLSIPALPEK